MAEEKDAFADADDNDDLDEVISLKVYYSKR